MTGPSGAGKSAIGGALARALGWPFQDADDLHPPENVAKMRAGRPLDEDDRRPWLAAVRSAIAAHLERGGSAVLACSALRRAHRQALGAGDPRVRFVLLEVSPALLAARLSARQGHFMPPALLPSQLATFEPSDELLRVDAARAPAEVVAEIRRGLGI